MPRELPVLALLGLREPKEGDWSRLHGMQYSSLARSSVPKIACHSIAALAVVRILLWIGVQKGPRYGGDRR
jgi:hypothetical protein